jgi:23S rRNA (uracil1939-C5)-methyltransferase
VIISVFYRYDIIDAMQIKIEKIVYPGKSLSQTGGKIIFTDEGLRGELVEVEPIKEKSNFIEAKTVSILSPSAKRIKPRCAHYKICSPYQYMDYDTQIKIKHAQLKEDFFAHQLKIESPDIIFRPSPRIWNYRNKISLNIIWENKAPHLAYNLPDSRTQFEKIEQCFLVSGNISLLLKRLLQIIKDSGLDFINKVVVKESSHNKSLLLTLYGVEPKELKDFSDSFSELTAQSPLAGAVYICKKKNHRLVLAGNYFIEEYAGQTRFLIGSESFFQTNIGMLNILMEDLIKSITLDKNTTVADLYCGVGTFGILLAKRVSGVIAVESSKENIHFLKKNLELNNITNFHIGKGDCGKLISSVLKSSPGILIIDPPRKGLDKNICRHILMKPPKTIAYISCNPATLTRDLKILLSAYKLKNIFAYDFFPQTPHMETMVILEKKNTV